MVIGGGPAGLSAALVLGRARRRVLVCDHDRPRNAASRGVHGYLTRDGIDPWELRALGREEAARYGVAFRRGEVRAARRAGGCFEVEREGGGAILARRLLLATGVVDRIPRLEGIEELFGVSVHHCPHCDGWEWRDRRLAAFGPGRAAASLALSLRKWSDDVVLVSDGPSRLPERERELLERGRVSVEERRVARLEGREGRLERVVFLDGPPLPRDALFLATGNRQASSLPAALGCRLTRQGALWTDRSQRTSVPGVYAAGDASRDVQFVVVAAAEGAKAAVAMLRELDAEERASLLQPAGDEMLSVTPS